MLLKAVECADCILVYPGYCEKCQEANQRIALGTQIKPTGGVGSIREDEDSYIIENDSIEPVAIARICPTNKNEHQKASDSVMVAFAWEMWERTLKAAQENPEDYEAADIVARADAMFQQLTREAESYV